MARSATQLKDHEAAWNHNIHYHERLLDAVPAGARDALDVGCGEGRLVRRLSALVPRATGIDPDEASIEQARREAADDGATFILGDFLTHPFEPESFDVLVSVAALHHMDPTAALARMRTLLRPGGVLGIIGLARSSVTDLPYDLAGVVVRRILLLRRRLYEPISPTLWPPPHTFAQVRGIVARELPGSVYRRHLLWRYTVLWRKPDAETGRRMPSQGGAG